MKKARKAKRYAKIIPRLKRVSYPKRCLFFDTETKPKFLDTGEQIQELYLGVAIYVTLDEQCNIKKKVTKEFYSSDEFFDILESYLSKKIKLYVFAHNIGFDLMVTNPFDRWNEQGIELKPPIHSGFRFIWRVKHPKGSVEFINTGNYVNYSLERIGQDLGFPKLDIDFNNATDSQLLTYCEQDTEIVAKFILELLQFLHSNDLGGFRPTIASQAMSVYRYRFMPETIKINTDLFINTIERDAYLGGRTEAFYIGQVPHSPIYQLDINSMYPYAMKQGFIPVEYRGAFIENDPRILEMVLDNSYCIVDCLLNTTHPFVGVKWSTKRFKIKDTDKKPFGRKLIFPIGQFRTYLHHDEFSYALKNNMIARVYRIYTYRPDDIFSVYVDFFTEVKTRATEQGNQTDRSMSKLFLNSLYGKFGQLFRDTQLVQKNYKLYSSPMEEYNINTGEESILFEWFGDIWREYSNGEASYSFPAIAGCITARARMILWDYILQAGRENVFYCDTDSIYTNELGFQRIEQDIHATRLGAMDCEEIIESMSIFGAKDYTKDGKRVVKGVPKTAKWLNDHVSIGLRFEGFKEWRNDGLNRPPKTWEQLKIKRMEYDKGLINDRNWVDPYIIENV